jgi:GT2 family glycosyltransferase
VRVSVVICGYTEERWDDMRAAVASARAQTLPPDEIILVIDHNLPLLERARNELTDVVLIENGGSRGVSAARNAGIALAQGELIAFLDDDAVAAPDWLERLCAPFADPRVLGAGGALEPVWEAARPAWFPDEFKWVVGCTYRGYPERSATVRNPIGANSCMRRLVFETVGGFRTGLGRQGKVPFGCEETELSIRALQHWPGSTFVFEPTARATHRVPSWRSRWAYYRARCYREGLSKARLARLIGSTDGLASERTYALRTLPTGVAANLAEGVLRRDRAALARAGAIIAGFAFTATGYLVGTLHEAIASAAYPSANEAESIPRIPPRTVGSVLTASRAGL